MEARASRPSRPSHAKTSLHLDHAEKRSNGKACLFEIPLIWERRKQSMDGKDDKGCPIDMESPPPGIMAHTPP